MNPLELIVVGFIHIAAESEQVSPEEMAKRFIDEANNWFHPKRKDILNSVSVDQRAPAIEAAKRIYKEYPTKTSVRKITKSPSKDIEALMFLILKYGENKVSDAFNSLISSTDYLPDLCRAIKKISAGFEEEDFETGRFESPTENKWQ